MTSVLSQRRCPSSVSIHNRSAVDTVVQDGREFIQKQYVQPLPGQRAWSGPTRVPSIKPLARQQTVDSDKLIGHTLKFQKWLNKESVKHMQRKTDQDALHTKRLYEPVLAVEDTFVKDVGDLVWYNQMLNLRKSEMLHKKWHEQIFEPIKKEIDKEMNCHKYGELSRRKRELYKEYLEHTNRKGHVFLDVVHPDEYYPFSIHPTRPSLLMAKTNKLKDPLHAQLCQLNDDDQLIYHCSTGAKIPHRDIAFMRLPPLPLVPEGRHGTECSTWLEMPLGDIDSPVRLASRRRMLPRNVSDPRMISGYRKSSNHASKTPCCNRMQPNRLQIPQDKEQTSQPRTPPRASPLGSSKVDNPPSPPTKASPPHTPNAETDA